VSAGKSKKEKQYPETIDASELLALEVDSLDRMATLQFPRPLSRWKQKIGESARSAKSSKTLNLHLSFEAPAPRGGSRDPYHIIELGVQIKPPLVTYCIAIGRSEADKKRLMRKFHFDIDNEHSESEPKPRMHIQTGGRLYDALISEGYFVASFERMLPDVDKPRIPSLPQSFALMAHCAFLEYQGRENSIKSFITTSSWIKVVTESEKKVLKPFFEYAINWLSSSQTNVRSFLSNCYER